MGSLVIKVSKDGSSREYLFSKLGPIVLGSDEKCDIRLEDLDPKFLEVKLSAGNIFVKELGLREQLFLDNVIIPFREEVPYQVGKTITMANNRYQIQILKAEESTEPPPFFSDDYKRVLEDLKKKIKEKEELLFSAEKNLEKRRANIENMDSFIRTKLTERNKREVEVEYLNQKLNDINLDLSKKHEEIEHQKDNLRQTQEHLEKLKEEDNQLAQSITKNESNLFRIKGDIERHHLELRDQKERLATLQLEEKKAHHNLAELKRESDETTQATTAENQKIQTLLMQSDAALREKHQIEIKIEKLRQEQTDCERNLEMLQHKLDAQEKTKLEEETKLQGLGFEVERTTTLLNQHKQSLLLEQEKERQLKKLNEELRLELIKVEDKLTSKKSLGHQLDFQNQDAQKKLGHLKSEIETATHHLEDLGMEEKAQDLKMLGMRQEQELYKKKISEERKTLVEAFESVKFTQEQELETLKSDIIRQKFDLSELTHQLEEGERKHKELSSLNKALTKERSELESKIEALAHRRAELERSGNASAETNSGLTLEKNRLENEISLLRLKVLDCEGVIRQRETEAQVEMEKLKREERSRIETERQIMLKEIEAERKKGEIHLDSMFKDNEEQVHKLKMEHLREAEKMVKDAQDEAAKIVVRALITEQEANDQATKRLNDVTQEVFEREQKANFRISEAQAYYEQKEREAEMILARAKKQTVDMVRVAEQELMQELDERKKKIKGYLTQRQVKGHAHIASLEEAQKRKLKKLEEVTLRNVETHKRKEYKKIARIKQEAESHTASVKEQLLKVAKEENQKAFLELQALKKRQEQELADTKKTFLEQLGTTKMRQQRSLEEALARQREEYETTKKQRLENASRAVLHALVAKMGSLPESSNLQEQIKAALDVALNGGNPETQEKVEQILDYNPLKKKTILPVLREYSLKYAAPAALAITLLADAGGVRTAIKNFVSEQMKQTESAQDKFVTNQREEWREKYTFKPETTEWYKPTYTDNILYTTSFYDVIESEAFQNEWLIAVNNFITNDLELSEDIAISFISSEGTMVKEMWDVRKEINPKFLDQGIKKLKDLEDQHMGWLPKKIADADKYEKFMGFKSSFYNDYYKTKYSSEKGRGLATQEEPNI